MALRFYRGTSLLSYAAPAIGTNGDFTYSIWIRVIPFGYYTDAGILGYGTGTNPATGQSLIYNGYSGVRTLTYYSVGSNSSYETSQKFHPFQWRHLLFTRKSGQNAGHTFVDGVLDVTGGLWEWNTQTGSDPFVVGRPATGDSSGQGNFNGDMAEVAYWHRWMTASEVKKVMIDGPLSIRTGLKFYAPLDVHNREIMQGIAPTETGTLSRSADGFLSLIARGKKSRPVFVPASLGARLIGQESIVGAISLVRGVI